MRGVTGRSGIKWTWLEILIGVVILTLVLWRAHTDSQCSSPSMNSDGTYIACIGGHPYTCPLVGGPPACRFP
jgi:hypothetical protein